MSNQKLCTVEYDWVMDDPDNAAILIGIGDREIWIPRSVVYEVDEQSESVEIEEWWAIKNELV